MSLEKKDKNILKINQYTAQYNGKVGNCTSSLAKKTNISVKNLN